MMGIKWDASMATVVIREFVTSHAVAMEFECNTHQEAHSLYQAVSRRVKDNGMYRNVFVSKSGTKLVFRRNAVSGSSVNSLYQFPPVKASRELGLNEQILKVAEELGEVACEAVAEKFDKELLLQEVQDLKVAIENVERKFNDGDVERARRVVLDKNDRRGYWG